MPDLVAWATLIGVLAAVLQFGALRKQRKRTFEAFYVERSWKIMDNLSFEGITGRRPDDGKPPPGDERAVIAYLRLSEDELDLWCKGWISQSTWELWWDGIETQLRRWPVDTVWRDVCRTEGEADLHGHRGEYRQLRGLFDETGQRLPGQTPARAWWRGLWHGS